MKQVIVKFSIAFAKLYRISENNKGWVNGLKKMISLCLLLFLSSCQPAVQVSDSSHITEAEVVDAFQENNVKLVEVKSPQEGIFGSKLKGVKPGTYELNAKFIFIYEFATADDCENGKRAFAEKTESMNVVSFSVYEKRNILIFYVHEEDLNSDSVPFEKEIKEALDSLVEG